ncbi:MAG: VirB4 family type IV secretion system protein, partial [Stackebrandtia sp.]
MTGLMRQWIGRLASRPATYPVPVEVWPDAVCASARILECGNGYSATFLVTGFPGEVPLAWLEALIDTGLHTEVALHVEPVDTVVATQRLKRRRARLESSRRYESNRDKLDDPHVEAAAADAAELAGRLATGDTRLFGLGVYITVHASAPDELDAAGEQLRSHAAAAMLDLRPATWRALPGRVTTLPVGIDALKALRTVDTDVVSAAFPFTSPDAPNPPTGVLYGLNRHTGAPVIWDRWTADNHNSVVVARSGAGKSYFTKTEILRQLYDGVDVTVIDPDGEYAPLAEHVDGTLVNPGAPGVHINPLDLPANPSPDALTRRILFAHTLVSTLLGEELSSDAAAALDDAGLTAYEQAGITHDRSTWDHEAPTLPGVHAILANGSTPAG